MQSVTFIMIPQGMPVSQKNNVQMKCHSLSHIHGNQDGILNGGCVARNQDLSPILQEVIWLESGNI